MNISVLGCGRWGSFLGWYMSSVLNFNTKLYGRKESSNYQSLCNTKRNEYVKLDDKIELSCSLKECIDFSDYIVISISSQNLRSFIRNITANYDVSNKIFILCMKGLETDTCKRLSEVCIEEGVPKNQVAVWLGPGHIQDFVQGIPNCMIIDSYNTELTHKLCNLFNSELIRFYYGNDIIGNEIGAGCKNIMGIVAGILDGLNYTTLKGPLMCRGAYEVSKFINAMGGNPISAYGLTHLGDYETTLFSKYSNNRNYGEQLSKNLSFAKLAEGVATTKAVYNKAKELNVEMPITAAVYNVLYNNADISDELNKLFKRSLKNEQHNQ